MAQLVVRDLEDSVKKRLQHRAKKHGHSMEEEVRSILRNAVANDDQETESFGTRFARHFVGIGLDEPFPEMRGHIAEPAPFDE